MAARRGIILLANTLFRNSLQSTTRRAISHLATKQKWTKNYLFNSSLVPGIFYTILSLDSMKYEVMKVRISKKFYCRYLELKNIHLGSANH